MGAMIEIDMVKYMDNCVTYSTQESSYPDRELRTKRAITCEVLCNWKVISLRRDTEIIRLGVEGEKHG